MKIIKEYFKKKKDNKELMQNALNFYTEHLKLIEEEEARRNGLMMTNMPHIRKMSIEEYDIHNPPEEPAHTRWEYNQAFIKELKSKGYSGTDEYILSVWEENTAREKLQQQIKTERENKKKSSNPWVEVVGTTDEEYEEGSPQVRTEFDWNTAFVKMLKNNGYTGSSEEIIVYKWFKAVAEIIATDIHNERFD